MSHRYFERPKSTNQNSKLVGVLIDMPIEMLVLFVVSLLSFGCGGPGESERSSTSYQPEYTDDGLLIVRSDVDHDSVEDVIKYFAVERDELTNEVVGRTLVRTELDLTGDGQVNMRREYDEDGGLLREELDGDLDGTTDHIIVWREGRQISSEVDNTGDGDADVFRYYREGFLYRVERDLDSDGDIDTWSYYDRLGMVREGRDLDNNGEPETWTRRGD